MQRRQWKAEHIEQLLQNPPRWLPVLVQNREQMQRAQPLALPSNAEASSHMFAVDQNTFGVAFAYFFDQGLQRVLSRPVGKIQETGKEKNTGAASEVAGDAGKETRLGYMTKGTNARWGRAPWTCFGVGVQEEGAQTQSVSQSHTSQVAVTDVCDCSAGDSSVSGKVFWAVANEAIAVEDFRWNRMFL